MPAIIREEGFQEVLVKPNKTVLRVKVRAIRPEPDGWGAEVDLEVAENLSPENDFVRPSPGSVLTAFAAEPDQLHVGDSVRVSASLAAGQFGGRVVIESIKCVGG